MAGQGPAPSATPNPNRRRRNAPSQFTKLPAEGRKGDPPDWPLGVDVSAQAKIERLNEQIDEASLAAQGEGRDATNAQRRLLSLRERVEILIAVRDEVACQERQVWADLWRTPQAVAWERLGWTRVVAQYARLQVRGEQGDMDALKEARQLSDRLGLSPLALLRLRWEVVADELADQRADSATRKRPSSAKPSARRGLKAVD